ncbi:maleylpyruvate isomerase family mycothiol-dependent enzyme [Nocardioides acrostichi]|uniref:Maleylpyruvate isomerase family mycothiol-dependent enzyme n=1 Tax=Nocardioides acrostichi TaxID=2784339 RepID=A0A930Y8B8_9ACTN|nr:maleylpyruvate isomerase family mycothiol-dependent enzyme [Nocardioides acrostichi]MBF4162952.1 maleylpyruvate isomerase family mycothiol-dependent enzyme [Nocardioides acrostichi]
MTFDWNALLTQATDDFALLTSQVDPTSDVPTCDDWCVADLVDHLAGVHQWARHAIVHGTPEGVPEPAPTDLSALAPWYEGHAAALRETLTRTDADAPAWTFGRQSGTAGWWYRRQVHETLMHTYDLLAAADRTGEWRIGPDLAWDGVAEVLDTFYVRQVRLARCEPLGGTLRLVATDLDDAAPVCLGEMAPVVEIAAPAHEILLGLWKRAPMPTTDETALTLLDSPVVP